MGMGRGNGGLAGLLVAKVVCCGGLVLFATGALSGFGAWLSEGGLVWLSAAALAVAAGFALRRYRQVRLDSTEDMRTTKRSTVWFG